MKQPNVSGSFYPKEPKQLAAMVHGFLSAVTASGNPWAIVAPHAGYVYSGATAAYAYKLLEGKKYKNVFILSPSHHFPFQGAGILIEDCYQTPLGKIPINQHICATLGESPAFADLPNVFEREHALEVQLPFLQTVLPDFSLIPIIIGQSTYPTLQSIADTLKPYQAPENLFVISTDLAHFHSGKENDALDQKTLEYIQKGDPKKLLETACELCGIYPMVVAMLMTELPFVHLKHSNSGDVTQDYREVVGYAAGYFPRAKE
jgi:AmmeMemoRadiSam system protein B